MTTAEFRQQQDAANERDLRAVDCFVAAGMSQLASYLEAMNNLCDKAVAYVDAERALDHANSDNEADELRGMFQMATADLDQASHEFYMVRDSSVRIGR